MAVLENSNIKVRSIPIGEIKSSKNYLSVAFYSDKEAVHELHCFVREICSKNAYPIEDIINMVRLSKVSLSEKLNNYVSSLSDKQLKKAVTKVIFDRAHDGYSTTIYYNKNWKIFWAKGSIPKKTNMLYKLFYAMDIMREDFYYYEKEYVNVYTTPECDLPLYINHDWPSPEDRELFNQRILKSATDAKQ
jgi:hypothetical protein